jgi:nitroreductase
MTGDDAAATLKGFFEVVLSQRACRRYADRPVSDELVERCLEAATHAPSAENLQPWEFVVVRDPVLRTAIGDLTNRAWQGGGRQHSEGRLPPALLEEVHHGAEGGIASAPVIVVVGGNSAVALESTLASSVFPAVQNLLLAASALGLGSAMTTLAVLFADQLRELLSMPADIHPMAVIPIGWPAAPLGRPRRLPVSERAHRDRFGTPW